MKVFISWSGQPSRELAEALHWWLPKVIQGIVPFVSAKDIDKGANWTTVLAQELDDTSFGILCVTQENLVSPWLNYEAGAIAKSVDARVCPLLLGVKKDEISGPLAQLQLTSLDFEDVVLMVRSINKSAGSPLLEADVDESAKMWWPRLEERVETIEVPVAGAAPKLPEPKQPQASENELLMEVLSTVRRLESRVRGLETPVEPSLKMSHSPSISERLLVELRNEGLPAERIEIAARRVSIKVPEPVEVLPGRSYDLLADAARLLKRSIRVAATNRNIDFDANGLSDEPPF